ncbi:MAG: hypothetical protein V2A73_11170 [Pseudomonadota bacterium]
MRIDVATGDTLAELEASHQRALVRLAATGQLSHRISDCLAMAAACREHFNDEADRAFDDLSTLIEMLTCLRDVMDSPRARGAN